MRRTVSGGGGEEGQEMGLLYYFVSQRMEEFIYDYEVSSVAGPSEYTFAYGGKTVSYDAYTLELSAAHERQVVWCDAATYVPIAIDIYNGDKLTIEMRIVDYDYNGSLPEAAFVIPN